MGDCCLKYLKEKQIILYSQLLPKKNYSFIASRIEKMQCKYCENYVFLWKLFIYLFIYLLFSHNKDYTSITLYKDVARGPQKTTRLVLSHSQVFFVLLNLVKDQGPSSTIAFFRSTSKILKVGTCNFRSSE